MKFLSSKRRIVGAGLIFLLVLFLLRPGAASLKSRLISSISASVGRSVDIGSVHLRLLPRPGFDVENLVVYDDPVFGAEPMLRASEVTADLRLTSLLRGKIEIARLDLTEPSLNLVHREGGGWNLEALVKRAASNSSDSSGNAKVDARPHFPYIEGSSGRINFKAGTEKKPYALINADFALWQDSENAWGGRLKAQPFRSDLNLTDVGQLQVSGTWQRAQTLRETPLEVNLEWTRAQVGQVTKFLTGSDKGWRGDIQVQAAVTGSLSQMKIAATTAIDDFRRYDITTGTSLRLAARCGGQYSSQMHEFHEVLCSAPVGDGLLTLTGELGLPGSHRYAVSLKADNVPAKALVMLTQRAKKNVPEDMTAEGALHGTASLHGVDSSGQLPRFEGEGEIANLHLSSAVNKAEFGPATVPFVITDSSVHGRRQQVQKTRSVRYPKGVHVEFGPVALTAGRNAGATAKGWLNSEEYSVDVAGDTDIARALRLARMIGIPVLAAAADGTAQLNLQIAGPWYGAGTSAGVGFPGPQVMGAATLRGTRVTIPGASAPAEISSAEMQFASDGVRVRQLNAKAAGTVFKGSLDLPRACGTPEACTVRFALKADEIGLSRLAEWVNGGANSRPWYRVLEPSSKSGSSFFARLRASGLIAAGRFVLHGVTATNVTASMDIDSGKTQISNLQGDVFGGKYTGRWNAEFGVSPSVCKGTGTFSNISLGTVADRMGDDWVSGKASSTYEVKGPCTGEFWQMADGTLRVEMRDGKMPRLLIGAGGDPLTITRLSGQAALQSGTIVINSARLDSQDASYQLSGSASLKREIDLKMTRIPADATHSGYEITGTLEEPHVSRVSHAEQAQLKPVAAK